MAMCILGRLVNKAGFDQNLLLQATPRRGYPLIGYDRAPRVPQQASGALLFHVGLASAWSTGWPGLGVFTGFVRRRSTVLTSKRFHPSTARAPIGVYSQ